MTSLVISARYRPWMKLSVFRKMVLSRDSPMGLYLRLNLSNLWKESLCAWVERVGLELWEYRFRHPRVLAGETYMHVKGVYAQIIRGQVDALEDLGESEMAIIPEQDDLVGALLHLALDEPQ